MTQESAALEDEARARHGPRSAVGIGTAVVLALGGVVLGVFGGFLQAWTFPLGGVVVPVGFVLTLGCLVACIRALIHAFDTRKAGIAFFLGWVVSSVLLALPTSEGDIVIARDGLAVAYLFGGVVLGSACANVPARLRPPDATTVPQASGSGAATDPTDQVGP